MAPATYSKEQQDRPDGRDLVGSEQHLYRETDQGKLYLHVFSPDSKKFKGARPGLILFFGGGWKRGEPWQFGRHAKELAEKGLVVILPDYRTKQRHGATPRQAMNDARAVVRWTREHAADLNILPDRIAAGGGSAGGHLAAVTALIEPASEDDVPDALVLFNPVIDTSEKGYGASRLGRNSEAASPAHHVRENLPPTIIFHGDQDATVPHENVARFTKLMKEKHNSCTLHTYDGQGHSFYWREPFFTDTLDKTVAFFGDLAWIQDKGSVAETDCP